MKQIQTLEKIEENNKQRDFGFIKRILSNISLLKWVRQFSADNLSEDVTKIADNFKDYIKISQDTIGLMDESNVKMLLTDTKFNGKALAIYSLEHIEQIIKAIGIEGRLIVVKENFPCFVEGNNKEGSNLIVLAPRLSTDEPTETETKKHQKVFFQNRVEQLWLSF